MPKNTTPHQRGIINRYYKNKDSLMTQKLSEIVSELYLCTDPKKTDRLWKSAETALKNLEAPPAKINSCVAERDLQTLARMLEELF